MTVTQVCGRDHAYFIRVVRLNLAGIAAWWRLAFFAVILC